jgi:hypothetical protein
MSTARRKKEIERLREEGAQAFREGKTQGSNPYPLHNMNYYRWCEGFCEAEDEAEQNQD